MDCEPPLPPPPELPCCRSSRMDEMGSRPGMSELCSRALAVPPEPLSMFGLSGKMLSRVGRVLSKLSWSSELSFPFIFFRQTGQVACLNLNTCKAQNKYESVIQDKKTLNIYILVFNRIFRKKYLWNLIIYEKIFSGNTFSIDISLFLYLQVLFVKIILCQ